MAGSGQKRLGDRGAAAAAAGGRITCQIPRCSRSAGLSCARRFKGGWQRGGNIGCVGDQPPRPARTSRVLAQLEVEATVAIAPKRSENVPFWRGLARLFPTIRQCLAVLASASMLPFMLPPTNRPIGQRLWLRCELACAATAQKTDPGDDRLP